MSVLAPPSLSRAQQLTLIALRFAVGWHLFLQGYGKLARPGWSAASYLDHATGPMAGFCRTLATHPTFLGICDVTVPWALLVTGALLMVGLLTRTATIAAILLVAFFVLAHPPLLVGGVLVIGGDGNAELYVNQTVLEILALVVTLTFDTGRIVGLDVLLRNRRARNVAVASSSKGQAA